MVQSPDLGVAGRAGRQAGGPLGQAGKRASKGLHLPAGGVEGKAAPRGRVVRLERTVEVVEGRGEVERRDRRVRHLHDGGEVDPDVGAKDLPIGDLQGVFLGVPGDVAAAPAHPVVAPGRPGLRAHRGQEHEEARDADVVEGIIPGLKGPDPLGLLAGEVPDHPLREILGLRHPGHIEVLRRPPAAGRVAIDLRDAGLVQLRGELVGEPGAARVPARRVARPPGDPHAAPERLPVLPEHTGDLEQGRIPHGVVAHPDVPGVVVAVEQHESLRFLGAGDPHDRHRRIEPPLLQLGRDARHLVAAGRRDQGLAIRAVHRHHRNSRLAGKVGQVGRAPDGGADAPVGQLSRIDGDQGGRPQRLVVRHLPRHPEALGHHDPAPDLAVPGACAGPVEQLLQLRVMQVGKVDHRRSQSAHRPAHGHWLGAVAGGATGHPGGPGEAQE